MKNQSDLQKWMPQCLLSAHSFSRLPPQQLPNKIFCLIRHLNRKIYSLKIHIFDFIDGLLSADVVEGSFADQ